MQIIALILLLCAMVHTFSVQMFQHWANRFPEGSIWENFFHLLGEVEAVFGIWAGVYMLALTVYSGSTIAVQYANSLRFTEPVFIFTIVCLCSTRAILEFAECSLLRISTLLPFSASMNFFLASLVVGPLLGSFITEPAAMTVTALVLLRRFYVPELSAKLKYSVMGLLFVSVSIGGTLTHFAAPPVLMVAHAWNWNTSHMFQYFGWKAILSILISTACVAFFFKDEINAIILSEKKEVEGICPGWLVAVHLVFLLLLILGSHEVLFCGAAFFLFLSFYSVTKEYQSEMKFREAFMVAFFLAGLVVLGPPQRWWLEPIMTSLTAFPLYLGVACLTAIADNALLTYLGSQVPSLSELSRYSIVSGAVVGGGLTVIANAPNPAGYTILSPAFGNEGISPWRLFVGALPPTLIALMCYWFL